MNQPAPIASKIQSQIEEQLAQLEKQPELLAQVKSAKPEWFTSPEDLKLGRKKSKETSKVLLEITEEEKQEVLSKLAEQAHQPSGQIEIADQLYFEQQLSDLLGFAVTSEKQGRRLPFVICQAEALNHWRREPNDILDNHQAVLEAGLSNNRSALGWIKPAQANLEKFGVSLPLQALANWAQEREQIREWYLKQQVVVINPARQKAAVAAVIDVGPAYQQRFQVGLSPELIRTTEAWHPSSRGKVVILLIDQAQAVELGPTTLS